MKLVSKRLGLIVAALWLCGSVAHAQSQQSPDPWFGQDKALHFSISAAISAGSYALAIPLWDEPLARVSFAASIGLSAGIAKELLDLAGYGDPSWRDFTWDVIGVALGTAVLWLFDLWLGNHAPDPIARTQDARTTARTASTGIRAVRTTFSATLPSKNRSSPVCPCVPITISVAPC